MKPLLLRLVLVAGLLTPGLARSGTGDCATQDWLAQAHHMAQVFAQQRDGPDASRAARRLLAALAQYPSAELSPRLRAAGLSGHSSAIEGFLRTQKTLADSQIFFGGTAGYPHRMETELNAFARQMNQIVPNMRCDEDPSWRPPATSSAMGRTTPTALKTKERASIFFPPNWPILALIACALVAALAAGSILLRRQALRNRRREKRFPCALSCTLTHTHAARQGRICDISQRGAKVCLGSAVPDQMTQCTLHSHQWSAPGRIVWRNAQCVGIAFRRPIPERELQLLIALDRDLHPTNA